MGFWGFLWALLFSGFIYISHEQYANTWFFIPILGLFCGLHLKHVIHTLIHSDKTSQPEHLLPPKSSVSYTQPHPLPLPPLAPESLMSPPLEQPVSSWQDNSPESFDDAPQTVPPLPSLTLTSESLIPKPNAQDYLPTLPLDIPHPDNFSQHSLQPANDEFNKTLQWLLGENALARVGAVILFIGLAFLAKYTIQSGFFPIEMRLSAIALSGLILLYVGFIKRDVMPQYALTLQGTGIAIFYLTLLASMRLYGLLGVQLTFVLLCLICIAGIYLALLQNSQALSFMSLVGGFAAPLLLSSGSGNYIILFSYYLFLNLSIVIIAYYKRWRALNLLGFIVTSLVGILWGMSRYHVDNYLVVQIFLILFYAIYLLTSLLYASHGSTTKSLTTIQTEQFIDYILIFGTPLIGFSLQYALMKPYEWGAAFSSLILTAVYTGLTYSLINAIRNGNVVYRKLSDCLMAIAVSFLTLTIPLALEGKALILGWAVESVVLFWIGQRHHNPLSRLAGVSIYAMTTLTLWLYPAAGLFEIPQTPFFNAHFLYLLLIAGIAGYFAYLLLRNPFDSENTHENSNLTGFLQTLRNAYLRVENKLNPIFYFSGLILVIISYAQQIYGIDHSLFLQPFFHYAYVFHAATQHIYLLASGIIALLLVSIYFGKPLCPWHDATGYFIFPIMTYTLFSVLCLQYPATVLTGYGSIFWLTAFSMHYAALYWADHHATKMHATFLSLAHISNIYLLFVILGHTLFMYVHHSILQGTAWESATFLISAIAVLVTLTLMAPYQHLQRWPFKRYAETYFWSGTLPLVGITVFLTLYVMLTSSGNAAPLPFIPVINPADLCVLLGIFSIMLWFLTLKTQASLNPYVKEISLTQARTLCAIAIFMWINSAWLRIVHHYVGVPWQMDLLFKHGVTQMGYTLLWSILALILMVAACRRAQRAVWLAGAGLLALTVVKLFLIDLANHGSLERIIAFITVGFIMLIIGYLSPIPPKDHSEEAK